MCAHEKIKSIMAGTVPGQDSTTAKINGSEQFSICGDAIQYQTDVNECHASVTGNKGMESRSAAIS